jgi:integrator complex subunit 11
MTIEIFPLGAGQEVGRSCIIIKIYDKTVMLDCGLHMGYNDERRFPDFSLIKEPHGKIFGSK